MTSPVDFLLMRSTMVSSILAIARREPALRDFPLHADELLEAVDFFLAVSVFGEAARRGALAGASRRR